MENEIAVNNISDSNIVDDGERQTTSSGVLAYDYYDYREVIQQQNIIIDNQTKLYDLVNSSFTFVSFILIISFIYIYIRNLIRK